MQAKIDDCPNLDEYFVKTSLGRVLARRHPYDFIDTYLVLRHYFGYCSYYVNFGYWKDGVHTVEPGRQLALELGAELGLSHGDRLIDVGSGLGQASLDLCRHHDLECVAGLNINPRQVAFANALTRSEGLDSKVHHIIGDASRDLKRFSGKGFNALIAIECVGHFSDPQEFLEESREILTPGARIALSVNIAASPLSIPQRLLLYAAFGFNPKPIETWVERLERTGYLNIRTRDVTEEVLNTGLSIALRRARQRVPEIHPIVAAYVKLQLTTALRSVSRGALGYYFVSASVPN